MDDRNLKRRRLLGGMAAAGSAGLLAQLDTRAQAAEVAPPVPPRLEDLAPRVPDAAQAPTVKSIRDKVAYITGGSSGIGLGIAQALHEQGAKVVIGNIDDRQFAGALQKFPANDARIATVVHDVMARDQWERKADEIEKIFGPVDILVNNAGVGVSAGVLDGTYNDWDWLMGVNIWGPVYGCKTFIPRMRARPGSGCHVVTTTSTSGVLVGLPNGIYAVTKIAATGLMEQLRVDLRFTNVGTSALIPGITATNISQSESHRPEALQNAQPYAARAAGQPAPGTGFWDRPQDPLLVGRVTVDGILNNDLFICPAPEYRQGVEARGQAMSESMVQFVPAPKNIADGIAANRYLFTPIYAQEVAHRRATRRRDIKGV
jgi:NAD(P)-dependent dehydrogenase (short-subunit alcohol dehydrogenase family)